LEKSIKEEVLAGRPNNLSSVIGLAKVYKARNEALRRTTSSDWHKITISNYGQLCPSRN
jgi:hypothetical protein